MLARPPHAAAVLVERAEIDAVRARAEYENLGCHEHVEARPGEIFGKQRFVDFLFALAQTAFVSLLFPFDLGFGSYKKLRVCRRGLALICNLGALELSFAFLSPAPRARDEAPKSGLRP
jgi:hypothetical protein